MHCNKYIGRIDSHFWRVAIEGIRQGLKNECLSGSAFSDRMLLAYAFNWTAYYLMENEDACPVSDLYNRLSCLSEDKSIDITRDSFWSASYPVRRAEWPETFRIRMANSEWRIGPMSTSRASFSCFINIANPGDEDKWMRISLIIVPDLYDAVQAMDRSIPALMEKIPRERLLFARDEMIRTIEKTTESARY